MNFLSRNIKYLRKENQWTQQQLADLLNVKRALIGSYEEERATPKIIVLQQIARLFSCTIDDLVGIDLEEGPAPFYAKRNLLQVLPIVVSPDNKELIPIVPVKASAGYLTGLADPGFIESLPRFSMPIPELSNERTYRVFQIKGDSMLPVSSGSYIFCEFVPSLEELKDGQTYVLITKNDGLVYKRIYKKENGSLLLKSDNREYEPYEIKPNSIIEIWKAKGILNFELPRPEQSDLVVISNLLQEMKENINQLKR